MKRIILIFSLLFLYCATFAQGHITQDHATKGHITYEWHAYDDISTHQELALRFSSNSPTIAIRYTTTSQSTPLIDLSITDNNGVTTMLEGVATTIDNNQYLVTFSDKINYSAPALKKGGYEFQVWLPTQCDVESLCVGVEGDSFYGFSEYREERPIVICDLSSNNIDDINGAGNGFGAILSRMLDRAVCLTKSIESAAEIDAKAFVIDGYSKKIAKPSKIIKSIKALRAQWAMVPISVPIIVSSSELMKELERANIEDVHLIESPKTISNSDIAASYEAKLREVLHCPVGEISTTIAVSQRRVPPHKWTDQCQYILRDIESSSAKCAIIGNSIVHNWGGNPDYPLRLANVEGQDSWVKYMGDYVNMGIGADRIENLLWRVYNDQMEVKDFEKIIVMIGTNNLNNQTSVEEILIGVENLVEQIKIRQPKAQITLIGILPRKDMAWSELQAINAEYKKIATRKGVAYKDIGYVLIDENSIPIDEFFRPRDRVHPSARGYEELGKILGGL